MATRNEALERTAGVIEAKETARLEGRDFTPTGLAVDQEFLRTHEAAFGPEEMVFYEGYAWILLSLLVPLYSVTKAQRAAGQGNKGFLLKHFFAKEYLLGYNDHYVIIEGEPPRKRKRGDPQVFVRLARAVYHEDQQLQGHIWALAGKKRMEEMKRCPRYDELVPVNRNLGAPRLIYGDLQTAADDKNTAVVYLLQGEPLHKYTSQMRDAVVFQVGVSEGQQLEELEQVRELRSYGRVRCLWFVRLSKDRAEEAETWLMDELVRLGVVYPLRDNKTGLVTEIPILRAAQIGLLQDVFCRLAEKFQESTAPDQNIEFANSGVERTVPQASPPHLPVPVRIMPFPPRMSFPMAMQASDQGYTKILPKL